MKKLKTLFLVAFLLSVCALCFAASLAVYANLKNEFVQEKKGGFRDIFLASQFFKAFGCLCLSAAFFETLGFFLRLRPQAEMVFPRHFFRAFFAPRIWRSPHFRKK